MSLENSISTHPCYKHGHAGVGRVTPEYKAWVGMKERCENAAHKKYAGWGGRGIVICERWRNSFVAFLEDMGKKPSPQHSLHRKDNDGNYEPSNCIWATGKEQGRAKRNNRLLTLGKETMPVSAWAERLGLEMRTLHARLKYMPIQRALTLPLRKQARRTAR